MMRFVPLICAILKVEVRDNVSKVGTEILDNGIHSIHDEIYSIYSCYFEGGYP